MLKCRDSSLYTGSTNNLERRMEQHSSGRGSRYVRTRRPFTLVYTEEHEALSQALRRESKIKGLKRFQKEELVRKGQGALSPDLNLE